MKKLFTNVLSYVQECASSICGAKFPDDVSSFYVGAYADACGLENIPECDWRRQINKSKRISSNNLRILAFRIPCTILIYTINIKRNSVCEFPFLRNY